MKHFFLFSLSSITPVILVFGVAIIVLIVFFLVENLKDKKNFENKINNDYKKPKDEENDLDLNDTPK
jgi:low affinity Fe/Cu permease